MEDTLRDHFRARHYHQVLILVLMEDTLRVIITIRILWIKEVLILVLMEDTLREIL